MKKKLLIAAAIFASCMLVTVVMQDRQIARLTDERDRYKENTETLLEQTEAYKVRDSLNAAKVGTLELTLKEYEKWRAEDAKLAEELRNKNRDLTAVSKEQAQTIIELRATPRDTVVVVDSVPVRARKVECGDDWYTFRGLITNDEFRGTMESRDEVLLTETVRYKKFLFWKTKKVKDRELEAVSKNPHTKILTLEHVTIER